MGSGKGGGGGGRSSGRGREAAPYTETPNLFVDSLPGKESDYVRLDVSKGGDGALMINIHGDDRSDPERGSGKYISELSGHSINEALKGAIFVKPSDSEVRKQKDKLIDKEYTSRQYAKNSSNPGIHLNSAEQTRTAIQRIVRYEKDDQKTVAKAINAGLGTGLQAYAHKSQVDSIKKKLTFQEYEE